MRRWLALVFVAIVAMLASGCTRAVKTDFCQLRPATPEELPRCFGPGEAVPDLPFENLAVEGGGIKGVAYAGALRVLEEAGLTAPARIRRISGTSAGSMTALLIALGYTSDEIQKILLGTDFTRFEDAGDTGLVRFKREFGWFSGEVFHQWARCRVADKTGNGDFTFKDLHEAKGPDGQRLYPDLHILTTDLNRRQSAILSYETVPCMPLALAVRMSGSLPLFFDAVQVDLKQFQGDCKAQPAAAGDTSVFIDGGVLWNFPLEVFDQARFLRENAPDPDREEVNLETLGLHLDPPGGQKPASPVRNIPEYAMALYETMAGVQTTQFQRTPCSLARAVRIDNLGVGTADFKISDEMEKKLIRSGFDHTCSYLKAWSRAEVEAQCLAATGPRR